MLMECLEHHVPPGRVPALVEAVYKLVEHGAFVSRLAMVAHTVNGVQQFRPLLVHDLVKGKLVLARIRVLVVRAIVNLLRVEVVLQLVKK